MKKLLLLFAVALFPMGIQAQSAVAIGRLVGSGIVLATRTRSNTAHKTTKPAPSPAHFQAGTKSIPQQRTPANKVTGKAKEDIQTLESLLTACYQAYTRPEEQTICQNTTLPYALIQNIHKIQPTWNVQPYKLELAFYEQEQQRRQQPPATPEAGR